MCELCNFTNELCNYNEVVYILKSQLKLLTLFKKVKKIVNGQSSKTLQKEEF